MQTQTEPAEIPSGRFTGHGSQSEPQSSAQTPARTNVFYRPELDALRFFAFVLVFIHHLPFRGHFLSKIIQAGIFGLPIFFCLSGYLIVTLLLKEKANTGKVSLRRFALRRILRIWPLYFGILGVGWALGQIWPAIHMGGKQIFLFAVMLGNFWILRHGWAAGPAAVVWSISIEEQFYVGIPFLIRKGGRRSIFISCVVALILAYLSLLWVHVRGEDPGIYTWANSFVQFQFFAVGGLFALAAERWSFRLSLGKRIALSIASLAAYAVAATIFISNSLILLIAGYLLALMGTAGIFLATLWLPLKLPSFLTYLGKITYSSYVFHNVILWSVFGPPLPGLQTYAAIHPFQGTLLAFLLAVLCGSVSYRFFETPILRFKDRFSVIHTGSQSNWPQDAQKRS